MKKNKIISIALALSLLGSECAFAALIESAGANSGSSIKYVVDPVDGSQISVSVGNGSNTSSSNDIYLKTDGKISDSNSSGNSENGGGKPVSDSKTIKSHTDLDFAEGVGSVFTTISTSSDGTTSITKGASDTSGKVVAVTDTKHSDGTISKSYSSSTTKDGVTITRTDGISSNGTSSKAISVSKDGVTNGISKTSDGIVCTSETHTNNKGETITNRAYSDGTTSTSISTITPDGYNVTVVNNSDKAGKTYKNLTVPALGTVSSNKKAKTAIEKTVSKYKEAKKNKTTKKTNDKKTKKTVTSKKGKTKTKTTKTKKQTGVNNKSKAVPVFKRMTKKFTVRAKIKTAATKLASGIKAKTKKFIKKSKSKKKGSITSGYSFGASGIAGGGFSTSSNSSRTSGGSHGLSVGGSVSSRIPSVSGGSSSSTSGKSVSSGISSFISKMSNFFGLKSSPSKSYSVTK